MKSAVACESQWTGDMDFVNVVFRDPSNTNVTLTGPEGEAWVRRNESGKPDILEIEHDVVVRINQILENSGHCWDDFPLHPKVRSDTPDDQVVGLTLGYLEIWDFASAYTHALHIKDFMTQWDIFDRIHEQITVFD